MQVSGYVSDRKSKIAHIWVEELDDTLCTHWEVKERGAAGDYHFHADIGGKKMCQRCAQFVDSFEQRIDKVMRRRRNKNRG
jgi:hypothetical protein